MSGDEIIGDIAQGALIARAVEPEHGEAADGHTHERACLNCGTVLVGQNCHACGQAAHVHKTLGAFFHDLLHGVFHFEGKIWLTLPLLMWNPGRLTREYIDGRRASYVSPIALFLFCVFLMFAAISAVGDGPEGLFTPTISSAMAGQRADLAELQARKKAADAAGEMIEGIDERIAKANEDLAVLEKLRRSGASRAPLVIADESAVQSDIPWLDAALKKTRANPDLLIYKLQTSAYKYAWGLIPLSVPFVWLLLAFRRRYGLYDHTVFVTYSLCFIMLLVVVLSLLGWAGVPFIGALGLLPPLHIYWQLKGTYALSRFGAVWRALTLSLIAFCILALFAMALLALGVAN